MKYAHFCKLTEHLDEQNCGTCEMTVSAPNKPKFKLTPSLSVTALQVGFWLSVHYGQSNN